MKNILLKRILTGLLINLFATLILYLAGSFYSDSLDISLWKEYTRGVVATFSVVLIVIGWVIAILAEY